MIISKKILLNSSAVFSFTSRLKETIPPKMEVGSQEYAFSKASSTVFPIATPQGVECFKPQQAISSSNSCTTFQATSISRKLLKDSSFP